MSLREIKTSFENSDVNNLPALVNLFFNVDVLFCVATEDGYFTLLNPYWTEVLGWSVDELMAKPFMEFVHPDDLEATAETAESQYVDNQAVNQFVNRYRTKEGDYRYLEWTAHSPEGGIIYAVARDITERRRKDTELKHTQHRLQELVQNVPGAFFQYVVKDDGTHTMNYMSPGSVDIWGLTPEEIGNDPTPLWQMILPEDVGAVQESVEISMASQSRWQQEYRIQLPTGEIKWLRGVGTPRKLDSGDTFWNSLVMDLTELREQQNTIARMQRMDMIGHLASGISHDFNNILAIIDGHRQLLSLKTDDPELKHHIDLMETAVDRARQLTKRLLMSSKKNIMPTGEVVSIVSSLQDIRTLLDEVTPPNINVRWNIDKSCNAKIESSEFDDVVTNLFINAKNALDDGGCICIKLESVKGFNPSDKSYVHLKPATSEHYSVLRIEDNGCGIEEKEFENIFIPFVTSSESGTGLGLAMAVGFASRNNCGLTLRSEVGNGTTISIWLPNDLLDTTSQLANEEAPKANPDSYRIALVDDEVQALEVVTEMLSLHGHTVTPFSDSTEALDWLRANYQDIDLILTDEIMPGGVQGHHIFAEFEGKLPIKIMSGYLDTSSLDIDDSDVLQKPISLNTLQRTIQEMMSD